MKRTHKSLLKLGIQLAVVALVVFGVVRAVSQARREMNRQAQRAEQLLAELDEQLAGAEGRQRRELQRRREQVLSQRLNYRNIDFVGLALAGAAYLLALLPAWLYWHRILRAMGQRPTWFESLHAYYIGHLGKYLPGKALVVILRTSLVRSPRTLAAPAALAVFVETLTTMAVGASVAAVCLLATAQARWLVVLSLGLMVGAGLPTFPPLFRRIVRQLRVKRLDQELTPFVDCVDGRLLLSGWLLGVVNWAGMGVCLFLVLRALPGAELSLSQLPLLTGAVGLAAVAGFLSLLPGGIGVRELVVTEVLAPAYGVTLAMAGAVVLRLCWLVCELALSAILYGLVLALRAEDPSSFETEQPG